MNKEAEDRFVERLNKAWGSDGSPAKIEYGWYSLDKAPIEDMEDSAKYLDEVELAAVEKAIADIDKCDKMFKNAIEFDITGRKYKHEGFATTLKNLIDSGVLALDEEFLKRK